jgi:hypothetical protein
MQHSRKNKDVYIRKLWICTLDLILPLKIEKIAELVH